MVCINSIYSYKWSIHLTQLTNLNMWDFLNCATTKDNNTNGPNYSALHNYETTIWDAITLFVSSSANVAMCASRRQTSPWAPSASRRLGPKWSSSRSLSWSITSGSWWGEVAPCPIPGASLTPWSPRSGWGFSSHLFWSAWSWHSRSSAPPEGGGGLAKPDGSGRHSTSAGISFAISCSRVRTVLVSVTKLKWNSIKCLA